MITHSRINEFLNFFKEKAREFIIERYLNTGDNNREIGARVRNMLYPVRKLAANTGGFGSEGNGDKSIRRNIVGSIEKN